MVCRSMLVSLGKGTAVTCRTLKTKSANGKRTIHTYHTEGDGGGHAPDIIKVVQESYVLLASTNPARLYPLNTVDEHLDMMMVAHYLSKDIPEDVIFVESRIRKETIAAEDYLRDIGAFSIMPSHSQAMGRVGEAVLRTWNTAHKMMEERGQLSDDLEKRESKDERRNNEGVKRYISKYTINPATAHGMSHLIGSVEKNKLTDLVLWKPSNFGTKPDMVLKSGMVVTFLWGDPNGSIPTIEPMIMRPQFAALLPRMSIMWVSPEPVDTVKEYGLRKEIEPVKNCRVAADGKSLGTGHIRHNTETPEISVDPETFTVEATIQGKKEICDARRATRVPLA